jgi:ATP-dependent Clp protease ATP-binding subunit ClpC
LYSNVIKSALEREVAGQPRAINAVVRGVTRVASGLTPRERTFGAYLFAGPTGTGKTYLVQSLARTLHGEDDRLVVADCARFAHADPWLAFVGQIAPLFTIPRPGDIWGTLEAPPLSIVLIEYLERGTAEIFKALAAALETGYVLLPHGRRGSLRDCLIFLTTGLCSREILDDDARGIGFSTTSGEDETGDEGRLYRHCLDTIEKNLGSDLLGRLDGTIVFHKLEPRHLNEILDRRIARLSQWMWTRGVRCEVLPAAREFLLVRGGRDLRRGAADLVCVHREQIEFPLADLLISGRVPPGGRIVVDHRPGEAHLHFTIAAPTRARERHAVPVA